MCILHIFSTFLRLLFIFLLSCLNILLECRKILQFICVRRQETLLVHVVNCNAIRLFYHFTQKFRNGGRGGTK